MTKKALVFFLFCIFGFVTPAMAQDSPYSEWQKIEQNIVLWATDVCKGKTFSHQYSSLTLGCEKIIQDNYEYEPVADYLLKMAKNATKDEEIKAIRKTIGLAWNKRYADFLNAKSYKNWRKLLINEYEEFLDEENKKPINELNLHISSILCNTVLTTPNDIDRCSAIFKKEETNQEQKRLAFIEFSKKQDNLFLQMYVQYLYQK